MVSINYDSIIKDICFNKPIKCNDIYIANVSNPTFIKLPKLNILTTGKNDRNCYELWYHIDLNTVEGTTLIKMLHGLDICALNEAEKKSGTWFGKSIKRERLEQLYIPPYNKDKNDIAHKSHTEILDLQEVMSSNNFPFQINEKSCL